MVQASGSIYLSTDVSRQAVEPIGMSIGKLKDRRSINRPIDRYTDRQVERQKIDGSMDR